MNKIGILTLIGISIVTAEAQTTNAVNFSLTAYVQNTSNDNGTIVTTAAPVRRRAATKDLMTYLEQDLGPFPQGSQLALVAIGSSGGLFEIVDSHGNFVEDLTGIMDLSVGTNVVFSGKNFSGITTAAPTQKGLTIVRVSFDDTRITGGAGIQFYFQGLLSGTITDRTVQGNIVETQTGTMTGAGEGTYQNIPMMVSGSMSFRKR